MSATRIYQAVPLAPALELSLDKAASHHLANVLRAKVGDGIILFNGDGKQYPAEIRVIAKREVQVQVLNVQQVATESPIKLHLAQGIARGEKMDWVIQKAVELGVASIYPLQTERVNVRLSPDREAKRLSHWQGIVTSACEQSGRVRLPVIHPVLSLPEFLKQIRQQSSITYVLSPYAKTKLVQQSPSHTQINFIIGPEGGLSDGEVNQALQVGCQPLNLGPRILRTETAALSALSILQFYYGDL